MKSKAGEFGFYIGSRSLDRKSTTRNEGIQELKKWISCGVPVIVNIDEKQDTSLTSGEHYKVLIGYDDNVVLGYYKKDGSPGTVKGALYFVNSGAKGLDEPDNTAQGKPTKKIIDDIANTRRENHENYEETPIGNDVDSYKAFFFKWKHGGVGPFTDDLWFLPLFPYYYKCNKCDRRHRFNSNIGKDHWKFMNELVSGY